MSAKENNMYSLTKPVLQSAVIVVAFAALWKPDRLEQHYDNALVSRVQLAGNIESLDWENSLAGGDIEVHTTESLSPLVGKFLSLENSDRRSGRLVIKQGTAGESNVPCSRIWFIRNPRTNVDYRVRFNGLNQRFNLVRNDAFVKRASVQLAETGDALNPKVVAQTHSVINQGLTDLLELEVKRSNFAERNPSVRESENALWVTDLPRSDWKRLNATVDAAARSIHIVLKQPSGMWTHHGKPIIVFMSTPEAAEAFRERLTNRLKNSEIQTQPVIIVQSSRVFSVDVAKRLYVQAALAFESASFSSRPLPAWLRVGMAVACRREMFGDATTIGIDKAETTKRLKTAGAMTKTVKTQETSLVDEYIANAMVNELRIKDPMAYSEFLIDLKHGEHVESALEANFRFEWRYFLARVGQTHGVDLRSEITSM
ncbi:MAG: hypothetical protein WBD20_03315 [Pirellulaceae bacterium]